jgi:hypothetical protein
MSLHTVRSSHLSGTLPWQRLIQLVVARSASIAVIELENDNKLRQARKKQTARNRCIHMKGYLARAVAWSYTHWQLSCTARYMRIHHASLVVNDISHLTTHTAGVCAGAPVVADLTTCMTNHTHHHMGCHSSQNTPLPSVSGMFEVHRACISTAAPAQAASSTGKE